MQRVLDRLALVAATGATVLVSGETGTGKELVARAIHATSARAKRPFVRLNCGALAEGLVASELFGHERGAFTGALERRKGRFELANGGDDLRARGRDGALKTDARVVAATNRDLDEAAHEGSFRSDLLFRLNVVPIAVPPLRPSSPIPGPATCASFRTSWRGP